MSIHIRNQWRFGVVILIFLAALIAPAAAQDTKAYFDNLQQRLIEDGFDPERVRQLYADQKVFFETRGVSLYFVHNEAKLNYNKMTKRTWIKEGKAYKQRHKEIMRKAEAQFGVGPDIITAIILVETKFGRYVGNRSIINVLSTMSVLKEPAPREHIWAKLPEDRRYERSRYNKKADTKAAWAYKELKAFLTYTKQHQVDAASVKGSYAGALGIAQFMPTSILAYARDGNGDGRINLFEDDDAIISIASYLKHFGWKPGIDNKKAFKIVYHYNRSKYYVNAILKIAELLES